jgi:hypothetical protein
VQQLSQGLKVSKPSAMNASKQVPSMLCVRCVREDTEVRGVTPPPARPPARVRTAPRPSYHHGGGVVAMFKIGCLNQGAKVPRQQSPKNRRVHSPSKACFYPEVVAAVLLLYNYVVARIGLFQGRNHGDLRNDQN